MTTRRFALLLLLLFQTSLIAHAFAPVQVTRVPHSVPKLLNSRNVKRGNVPDAAAATDSPEDLNAVIEEVSGFKGGPIILPYKPERWWLWRCWSGTVLKAVLPRVAFNMGATMLLVMVLRRLTGASWLVGLKPDISHPLIARLALFEQAWKYLVTLTTFTMTFFLGEAFVLWKRVYSIGRQIQGGLNDISMLLATHAARNDNGNYTPESQLLLDNVAMNIRTFHTLLWASCSRHHRSLLTPQGLDLMVQRGLLTQTQLDTLLKLNLPVTQLHNAILEWIVIQTQQAKRNGQLIGDTGFEKIFLEKCCALRGTYATIGDVVDGRMPLAYVHLVQLSVDTLLFFAPLALYSELGAFSIVSVGILTFFFGGLVDLAKVLLDPLDNEDYCQDSVKIDLSVLIRESNDGSRRWKNGAAILPFSLSNYN
jgi:hypothetical protein